MSDLSRAVLAEVVRSGKTLSQVTVAHADDFRQGQADYQAGKKFSDCPFPVDTMNAHAWAAGWRQAAKDDE